MSTIDNPATARVTRGEQEVTYAREVSHLSWQSYQHIDHIVSYYYKADVCDLVGTLDSIEAP